MNRTLKETLTKLVIETGKSWANLLPLALLRARCTPYCEGFTPYEIMFGRSPPILPKLRDTHREEITNQSLLKSLQALQQTQKAILQMVGQIDPQLAMKPTHQF